MTTSTSSAPSCRCRPVHRASGHGWAWVFGGLGAHIVLTEITKALYRGHLAIFRRRQQRRKAELRANKVSLTDVMHEAERERQAKV